MKLQRLLFASWVCLLWLMCSAVPLDAAARPNILFIAVDDLNDWIGCLGGNPQTKTPNLDRFASTGVLFTNAHCAAPSCNPSRTAIFTGIPPHRSGLYHNLQKLRDVMPEAKLIPRHFSQHGYWSAGAGKLLHYMIDPPSWDDYFPDKAKDNPLPKTFYPEKRPVNLPVGGPWQYVETDWAALNVSEEEYGGDVQVTQWIGRELSRSHDKPFFLACGIYRPHEPWFVPKEYFKPFPLESIRPGPGYKAEDLDDLPPAGQKMGPNRYFEHIQKQGQWMQAIQAYLASIHFADAMVGRVIDSLDRSPYRDNTIVVLWSDHGWHLGEKQHWQKFTGWRICTRVPLIIRVPQGVAGLPEGTRPGVCDRPVSLVDLYRTLTDLASIPAPEKISDHSLLPLLRNPKAEWNHVAVTQLSHPDEFSVSAQSWRYIHYRDGGEELYDIAADPYEWNNLASKSEFAGKLAEMRGFKPAGAVPVPEVPVVSLPELAWHGADQPIPVSKPEGSTFEVVFINQGKRRVELCWNSGNGELKSYGFVAPGKEKRQSTRPGAVWVIRGEDQYPLGHFVVGDRTSKALIP